MCHNGWTRPIDGAVINQIMAEIRLMIYEQDCTEYGELVSCCAVKGAEYLDVVSKHTIYFDRLCSGFRHRPQKILRRILENELTDRDSDVFKNCLHTMYGYNNEYELPEQEITSEQQQSEVEESGQLPGQMNIEDFLS